MKGQESHHPTQIDLAQVFFRGSIDDVLKATVDQAFAGPVAPEQWPFVIGALCFKGRIDEAEIRYQGIRAQLDLAEQLACQFYLGIGFARLSQYARARALFAANLLHLRQVKREAHARSTAASIAFYAWQGIGFFHQLCGRKSLALNAARKAWQAAIAADDYFARMLATELLGHSLIGCGRVAVGLRELETAYGLAQNLGHGAYEKAIYRALLMYKIQFGYPPYDAVQTIQELLGESRVANNYTDNALSLELIRQLILRGELDRASCLHEDIGRSIYAERHRRHEVFWHLQAAEIAWLRSDITRYRQAVHRAEASLDPAFDAALQLHILGLKRREDAAAFAEPCAKLTRRLGSDIAARMLARSQGPYTEAARGEDPLGDILDALSDPANSPLQKFRLVVQSPYLGLLRMLIPLRHRNQSLQVFLPQGTLVIIDRGNITLADATVSAQTLELLQLISQGWVEKQRLVSSIWGYSYHPLKHDSLVYSLISRVRTQWAAAASWIEHGPQGYRLRPDVELEFHNFQAAAPQAKALEETSLQPQTSPLNARQLQILDTLETQATVNVADCVTLFGSSRITASRDLSFLCQEGLLERIGKGRATEYRLKRSHHE